MPLFFKCLLFGLFLFSLGGLRAQSARVDTLLKSEFRASSGRVLPYVLLHLQATKTSATDKPIALIVFLHGAGERGVDGVSHTRVGLPKLLHTVSKLGENCLILAPQCPENHRWADTDWKLKEHILADTAYWTLQAAQELLRHIEETQPVDKKRIYLTGLSMGGFGVWDWLMRDTQRFAAALPICGGGDYRQAQRLAHIPIYAAHGLKDKLVLPRRTTDMTAALRKAGNQKVRELLLPNAGHLCWDEVYAREEAIRWLLAQQVKSEK